MYSNNLTRILISGLLALLCTLPAAAANLAGTVVFASGKPTATGAAGTVRELKSGDKVYSGALLETRNGRVQIKFVDGAFMSIQPNSRFQIEDYNYTNGSDGSENAAYYLFEGGMRAFTGAIGKKHPEAYKVKTPVATIGIRGTGHNTSHCTSNCPGPEGTDNSTWEGTTIVTNDFESRVVPSGKSVHVQSIDSPVEETNEASVATAVQPSQDTADDLLDVDDTDTLTFGDELKCVGDDCLPPIILPPPVILPPAELVTLQNQSALGIETNLFRGAFDPDNADGGIVSDTTVFTGEDSAGTLGLAGLFGTEFDEDEMGVDETFDLLITIDPDGIDGTTGAAKDFLDAARLVDGGVNEGIINDVAMDPATIVPGSHYSGSIDGTPYGYGVLSDGKILFVDEVLDGPDIGDITVEFDDLSASQFFHYQYGETPATPLVGATGTYILPATNRGTASTDTHDGFVGNGVQSGSLVFDFTSLNGKIVNMVIDHADTYTVNGDLHIDRDQPGTFYEADNRVFADTNGGLCDNNSCTTLIEGSFFGVLEGTGVNGAPGLAGLNYEILSEPFNGASGNSIIGNAIFYRSGTAEPIPDTFTVIPGQGLVLVLPNRDPDPFFPDEFADIGLFPSTTNILGYDRLNTHGLVATAGVEVSEDNGEEFFVTASIDPLNVDDFLFYSGETDPNAVHALALIQDAFPIYTDEFFEVHDTPARLAEYFQGDGFAYGRWADGKVLALDENLSGITAPIGTKTAEVVTLTGYQSLAFVTGDSPATPLQGASGTYTLIASSPGTQSTTASGATIGQGVTSGELTFYFDNFDGWLNMNVNHLTDYNVSGPLAIDDANPGNFYDTGAMATTTGGNCDAGCTAFIDGGFAGALTGGPGGSPAHAGLEYDIADPVDGILGVAVFERTGDAPF